MTNNLQRIVPADAALWGFRPHLAVHTLAVRLTVSLDGPVGDLHVHVIRPPPLRTRP